ncbi:MAG TPA: response regulator transcription factor [Pseudonocardiaceae bacterium]|nr:response regulator transcription factor [Pseudonocardiaceae bacterium]
MSEGETGIVVAAVDDHPVVLRGLTQVFAESAAEITLGAEALTVAELLAGPGRHADVVLLDLLIPGERDVAENVRRLREAGARVVIFTSDSRPGVVRAAVDAGALGLVLKEDPEYRLVEAVLAAREGELYVSGSLAHAIVTDPRAKIRLSDREREVLTYVANGLPHKLIAKRMAISVETVPSFLKRAAARYAEAGVVGLTPAQVAAHAVWDGHVELSDPAEN